LHEWGSKRNVIFGSISFASFSFYWTEKHPHRMGTTMYKLVGVSWFSSDGGRFTHAVYPVLSTYWSGKLRHKGIDGHLEIVGTIRIRHRWAKITSIQGHCKWRGGNSFTLGGFQFFSSVGFIRIDVRIGKFLEIDLAVFRMQGQIICIVLTYPKMGFPDLPITDWFESDRCLLVDSVIMQSIGWLNDRELNEEDLYGLWMGASVACFWMTSFRTVSNHGIAGYEQSREPWTSTAAPRQSAQLSASALASS